MLFMMCCLVVMAATCNQMFSTLASQLAHLSDASAAKPVFGLALLALGMTLCFTSPMALMMLDVLRPDIHHTVAEGTLSVRRTVYLVLVGSLLVAAYAYLLHRKTPVEKRGEFWSVGRSVLLAVVVGVGVVSSISHLNFFRSSKDGIANVGFIRQMAPLTDMADCTG